LLIKLIIVKLMKDMYMKPDLYLASLKLNEEWRTCWIRILNFLLIYIIIVSQ